MKEKLNADIFLETMKSLHFRDSKVPLMVYDVLVKGEKSADVAKRWGVSYQAVDQSVIRFTRRLTMAALQREISSKYGIGPEHAEEIVVLVWNRMRSQK